MLIRNLPGINAIKVGRFYYKSRDIEETITMSCRMMLFESSDRTVHLVAAVPQLRSVSEV